VKYISLPEASMDNHSWVHPLTAVQKMVFMDIEEAIVPETKLDGSK